MCHPRAFPYPNPSSPQSPDPNPQTPSPLQTRLDPIQASIRLFVSSHADPQAVAPAFVVHVTDEDRLLFEGLEDRLHRPLGVDVPDKVRLGVDRVEPQFSQPRGQSGAGAEDLGVVFLQPRPVGNRGGRGGNGKGVRSCTNPSPWPFPSIICGWATMNPNRNPASAYDLLSVRETMIRSSSATRSRTVELGEIGVGFVDEARGTAIVSPATGCPPGRSSFPKGCSGSAGRRNFRPSAAAAEVGRKGPIFLESESPRFARFESPPASYRGYNSDREAAGVPPRRRTSSCKS